MSNEEEEDEAPPGEAESGLSWAEEEERLLNWKGEEVVDSTTSEKKMIRRVIERYSKLSQMENNRKKTYAPFGGLMVDIPITMFWPPGLHGDKGWKFVDWHPASLDTNRRVLEEVTSLPEYREGAAICHGDEVAAASMMLALDQHVKVPEEVKKEQEEVQKEEEELLQNVMKKKLLEERAENKQKQANKEQDPKKKKEKQAKADQAQQKVQQKQQQCQQGAGKLKDKQKSLKNKLDNSAPIIRAGLRDGLKAAVKDAKEVKSGLANIGGGYGKGDGEGIDTGDVDEKIAMARILRENQQVRMILDMVGKFKNMAMLAHESKTEQGVARTKIDQGNDLPHVLPSRLWEMDDPDLDIIFYKDYMERQLPQYSPDEPPVAIKGPMVFCLDKSGSMSGLRMAWALTFTLGGLLMAQWDKRPFFAITFSDTMADLKCYDLTHATLPQIVAFAASTTGGGGTDFDLPLKTAIEVIDPPEGSKFKKYIKEDFVKADIMFVTDGEATIQHTDLIKKQLADKKIRLYAVYIDRPSGNQSWSPRYDDLDKLAVKSWELKDLMKRDNEVGQMYHDLMEDPDPNPTP